MSNNKKVETLKTMREVVKDLAASLKVADDMISWAFFDTDLARPYSDMLLLRCALITGEKIAGREEMLRFNVVFSDGNKTGRLYVDYRTRPEDANVVVSVTPSFSVDGVNLQERRKAEKKAKEAKVIPLQGETEEKVSPDTDDSLHEEDDEEGVDDTDLLEEANGGTLEQPED